MILNETKQNKTIRRGIKRKQLTLKINQNWWLRTWRCAWMWLAKILTPNAIIVANTHAPNLKQFKQNAFIQFHSPPFTIYAHTDKDNSYLIFNKKKQKNNTLLVFKVAYIFFCFPSLMWFHSHRHTNIH